MKFKLTGVESLLKVYYRQNLYETRVCISLLKGSMRIFDTLKSLEERGFVIPVEDRFEELCYFIRIPFGMYNGHLL